MASYPELAASQYVLDAYADVSRLWREYEDFGDDVLLRQAAVLMCETFGRLAGDDEFWSATIDAVRDPEREAEAICGVLRDLSQFRKFEERALMDLRVPPDQASRLSADLILGIRMMEERPSGDTILNLKNGVGDFSGRICEAAEPTQPHRWRKRLVLKGMKVLGGAAVIVADGLAAAPTAGVTVLSIGGGAAIMVADVFGE